jgi:hypothetical protein
MASTFYCVGAIELAGMRENSNYSRSKLKKISFEQGISDYASYPYYLSLK